MTLVKGMRVVVERALGGPVRGVVFRTPRQPNTVAVLADGSKQARNYAQRCVAPEEATVLAASGE